MKFQLFHRIFTLITKFLYSLNFNFNNKPYFLRKLESFFFLFFWPSYSSIYLSVSHHMWLGFVFSDYFVACAIFPPAINILWRVVANPLCCWAQCLVVLREPETLQKGPAFSSAPYGLGTWPPVQTTEGLFICVSSTSSCCKVLLANKLAMLPFITFICNWPRALEMHTRQALLHIHDKHTFKLREGRWVMRWQAKTLQIPLKCRFCHFSHQLIQVGFKNVKCLI